jgi:peptide/nickel transport system ATP-binding protein/oligopeptide transport system ATP-binding protein
MTPVLQAENLTKHFVATRSLLGRPLATVKAVDGVSFALAPGETLALVGESGCGKSTVGRLLLRLLEPTAGRVILDGADLHALPDRSLRAARRNIQLIFQDPFASLNPRMTVGAILAEPLMLHAIVPSASRRERVAELLALVGLSPRHAGRYPHEFSGGQRQRVAIARALAVEPKVVVCDEAVSALDVSIRAQVINLLEELQARLGLAYVFISHDLSVVKHVADRIAVMYLGRIVETGTAEAVFGDPRHPYTRALLAAIPSPRRRRAASARSSPATCRARSPRRRAATSTPAAPSFRTSAGRSARPSPTRPRTTATPPPAISGRPSRPRGMRSPPRGVWTRGWRRCSRRSRGRGRRVGPRCGEGWVGAT